MGNGKIMMGNSRGAGPLHGGEAETLWEAERRKRANPSSWCPLAGVGQAGGQLGPTGMGMESGRNRQA